jgi:hypothetical protein
MYPSSVSNFLTKVKQGAKNNLFLVSFAYPQGLADVPADTQITDMLCKAAALPASNLGVIEVPYRGRTVKIAGDRTFDTWTATFINDRNFAIRHAMESWMEAINSHEANTATKYVPEFANTGYLADLKVKQLERDGNVNGSILREYTLLGCFPTNISQIDLAYDSNDQIEDFTVEFQLQYWTANTSTQGGLAAGTTTGDIN